jgi:predicted phosphoribosyltransferase
MPVYRDRSEAGRALAEALARYSDGEALVLALPRGGVPVAFEVAERLAAPLDVFLVRKLGVPGHEELAMGAIASGGVQILNESLIARLGIARRLVDEAITRERRELQRRELAYRDGRPPPDVTGRTVILIDDGLATGSTMKAAVAGLRKLGPGRIVVAVPVAAPEACAELGADVDEMVCLATPSPFHGVGLWYADFRQTDDAEVRALLGAAARRIHDESPKQDPIGV